MTFSAEFKIYDNSRHDTVLEMLSDLSSMRDHARGACVWVWVWVWVSCACVACAYP
jgi:hypothetical protein